MKPVVAFIISLELCLACSSSYNQNELIPELKNKCYLGHVINRYMNGSICYLTVVAIVLLVVFLKNLMDVVMIFTANDNTDVEGRSNAAVESASIANTEKQNAVVVCMVLSISTDVVKNLITFSVLQLMNDQEDQRRKRRR
ncbi:hypothetical protein T05_7184 [Trichinella murrelli]|uniref:Uncharacterized protein n=1 Tax=Trichinella murrelli TaxID=144512 RepID=A0A0V0U5V3_9BILA|nr:hypothetical protein T05_7184 [Trichinella murrelli]